MARKRVAEPAEPGQPEHPISGFRRVPRPLSNRGKWRLDNEVRELIAASEECQAVEYDISNPSELHKIHMNMRHVAKMKGYRFSFRKVGVSKIQAWVERAKQLNGRDGK